MSGNKIFVGIVSAAVVGAIIGLLVAPEDGAKTRKKIKKRTNSLAGELIDALEKSKQRAANAVGDAKDKAADKLEDVKDKGEAYKDEAVNKAAEYADEAKNKYNNF